jgi:hypothetical protein
MDRKSRVEPLDWKAPDSRLPRMIRIKQSFDAPILANVSRTVRAQLAQSGLPLRLDGLRIAVGVGSRGITNLQDIVITTVQWLKERGAAPFIVPAMGSHGGATAEGQAQVLAEFGITESCVGAPIVSSMDVVQLGAISSSIPVVMDKHAYEADGIVLINRIKSHTQFRSDIESGLLKLMVIGLGKDRMASIIHAHGIQGLVELLPQAARVVLAQGKILTRAKELMPSLPVDQLDLLVLDEMGKEISGPGMDSSITGRIMAHRVPDPEKPDIKILAVLDLTAKSMGNAVGLGVADLTTERLVKKMNRQTTYVNTIVGGFPVQGKIPMFFATDRELLQAAAQLIGAVPFHQARVIRAKNTLMMTELLVSEALVQEVCRLDRVEVVGDPGEWEFDEHGWLRPSFDSKAKHAS